VNERIQALQDAMAHAVERFAFWASDGQNSAQADAWAAIAFAIVEQLPGGEQEDIYA
jgi:predicted oxidoreductase (fatty acid repression mutant protein)